jgi:GT2 family glycosyltransferase
MTSVSVVSHRQSELVRNLFADLAEHCASAIEVVLTLNVPETLAFDPAGFGFPVRVLRNAAPRGFGANHNAAFQVASHDLFCVLNPDVRLRADPFPVLTERLRDPTVGVVAPAIRSPSGTIEDSARRVPTPLSILRKALMGARGPDYEIGAADLYPDWLAGMFMLFRRETFAALGGFDERYFLYYEDVDLCARLALAGKRAVLCPAVEAVHDARRQSHRDLRYLCWHVASLLRFFCSDPFRTLMWRRLIRRAPDGTRRA